MSANDRRLDITARVKAAAPGPWIVKKDLAEGPTEFMHDVVTSNESIVKGFTVSESSSRYDAAFIAAAREDVPWLLAELGRLDEALSRVAEWRGEGAIRFCTTCDHWYCADCGSCACHRCPECEGAKKIAGMRCERCLGKGYLEPRGESGSKPARTKPTGASYEGGGTSSDDGGADCHGIELDTPTDEGGIELDTPTDEGE